MSRYKCAYINYNDANSIGWNVDYVRTDSDLYNDSKYSAYKQYGRIRNLTNIRIYIELDDQTTQGNINYLYLSIDTNSHNTISRLTINSQDTSAVYPAAYCYSYNEGTQTQYQEWKVGTKKFISVDVSLGQNFFIDYLTGDANNKIYLEIVRSDGTEVIPLYQNKQNYDITYNSNGNYKYTVNPERVSGSSFVGNLVQEPREPSKLGDIIVYAPNPLRKLSLDTSGATTVYVTGNELNTGGLIATEQVHLYVADVDINYSQVSGLSFDSVDMVTPTRTNYFGGADAGRTVGVYKTTSPSVRGSYTIYIKPRWTIEDLTITFSPSIIIERNSTVNYSGNTIVNFVLVGYFGNSNSQYTERINYSLHNNDISFSFINESLSYSDAKYSKTVGNGLVNSIKVNNFDGFDVYSNETTISPQSFDYERPVKLVLTISQTNTVFYYNELFEYKWDISEDISITAAKIIYNTEVEESVSTDSIVLTDADNEGKVVPAFNKVLHYSYTVDGETFVYEYSMQNIEQDDLIETDPLVLTNTPTVVLAHKLSEYQSNFNVKAYFLSGNNKILSNGEYSFSKKDYLTEPLNNIAVHLVKNGIELSDNIILKNSGREYITYNLPTVDYVSCNETIKTSYIVQDYFDFTNYIFTVHYVGTNYTSDFDFDDYKNNIDNSISILDNTQSANFYDGQESDNFVQLGIRAYLETEQSSVANGDITISFRDYFGSRYVDSSTTIPFSILEITNIKGIQIINAYTNYHTGDTFPKEEDNTTIRIYYEDNSEQTQIIRIFDMPLRSKFSYVMIEPYETTFNNIDRAKTITVKSVLDNSVSASYTISVMPKNYDDNARPIVCSVEYSQSLTFDGRTIYSSNGKGLLRIINTETNELMGYIDNIFDEETNAKMVLFYDFQPKIDGASNIEITYPYYIEGSAEEIDKCHFGILFGANNAVNRLFVSGNPDEPNADWHTAEINTTDMDGETININGNFSYISDESIMYYGETDNDVVGYEIVSNDKLLVLKTKSDKEKTVYFRNPTVVQAIDASGNNVTGISGETLYQEEFSLTKGNNSNAGISPKTIVNFNGDTLFIDANNQLVGLDLTGIVGDNQRYANSRSKYIDKMLKDAKKEDFSVWTNNKYLFLAVKDVGVFVTHYETYHSDLRQYEWWLITSENPTTFVEIDNVIYFANEKGELYKFNEGQYQDIHKVFSNYAMNVSPQGSIVVQASDIAQLDKQTPNKYKVRVIKQNDEDYAEKLYYRLATISSNENDNPDFLVADGYLENVKEIVFPENNDVYLNFWNTEGNLIKVTGGYEGKGENDLFVFGRKYRLKKVETDEVLEHDIYELYKVNSDGTLTQVSVETLEKACICDCINDEDEYIGDFGTNYFYIMIDGQRKPITTYGKQAQENALMSFKCEIKEFDNVSAYYVTAPFTMGNINYFKTMWSYTLTNDTDLKSEIEIAFTSNKIPCVDTQEMSRIEMSKDSLGVYLTDFNYKKVDFDKRVVPRTYTTYRTLPYQKFICFAFKNENNTNAVLSAMSVVYTLAHPSYGGD